MIDASPLPPVKAKKELPPVPVGQTRLDDLPAVIKTPRNDPTARRVQLTSILVKFNNVRSICHACYVAHDSSDHFS